MEKVLAHVRLVGKGAEADLFLGTWHHMRVLVKKRVPKLYRLQALDARIRSFRTAHEARLLQDAKKCGVPTPTVYLVDLPNTTIVMEYISKERLKERVSTMGGDERSARFTELGENIGLLHQGGIIHGDLTTSNVLIKSNRLYLIDLGLGTYSEDVEDRGVDLHLLWRVLQSSHHRFAKIALAAVVEGYERSVGRSRAHSVEERMWRIDRRGRYIAER